MVLATRNSMLLILRWMSSLIQRDNKSVARLQPLESWLQNHVGLKRMKKEEEEEEKEEKKKKQKKKRRRRT